MDHDPKQSLDLRYNFNCDGCLKRRNKRMSQVIEGKAYCRSCLDVINDQGPKWLADRRGITIEAYEQRPVQRSTRFAEYLAWKERRHQQKRGRL